MSNGKEAEDERLVLQVPIDGKLRAWWERRMKEKEKLIGTNANTAQEVRVILIEKMQQEESK